CPRPRLAADVDGRPEPGRRDGVFLLGGDVGLDGDGGGAVLVWLGDDDQAVGDAGDFDGDGIVDRDERDAWRVDLRPPDPEADRGDEGEEEAYAERMDDEVRQPANGRPR